MTSYTNYKSTYLVELQKINIKHSLIGWLRLLCVAMILLFIYKGIRSADTTWFLYCILPFIAFLFLIKLHEKLSSAKSLFENLIAVITNEEKYLDGKELPFDNGVLHIDNKHYYSYDLDIFGEGSLYHHLNRTATHIGKVNLSELLKGKLEQKAIVQNQEAIKELSDKLEWRLHLAAISKMVDDSKEDYKSLIFWTNSESKPLSKLITLLSYILPILFCFFAVLSFFEFDINFGTWATLLFILNVGLFFSQMSIIKKLLTGSERIAEIIKNYAMILAHIEKEEFQTKKLIDLRAELSSGDIKASYRLGELGTLYSNLQNIENAAGAFLFNGTMLYHLHAYRKLQKWKATHAKDISQWLDVIGEFEAISSLANLRYNNPDFIFPTINEELIIDFENLGHPLIDRPQRICNDISFSNKNFIILTGSNMAGKSTFLRTVGINMILAGIGSAVCAKKANVHTLDVLVSMRQTDSLVEKESYFFAEVKRLKLIMDKLETTPAFVLLDEILKGTNSDDKQSGTLGVIKKMVTKKTLGMIATHDLEVCNITTTYPDSLTNKCFEVEIKDNELSFDYKLREGICKSKSASFLMHKMEII